MISVKRLVWDSSNITHVARHNVVPEEVEEACHSDYITFTSYKGRFLLIGLTDAGRMLAVILDPELEKGVYYPVTARSADIKERRLYRELKRGDHNDKEI